MATKASEMNNDNQTMLEELLNDDSDRMTPCEVEFIESLNRQRDRSLSERQVTVLARIWNKVFAI